MSAERRKFRRIQAPLYCRPAGMEFLARQREPIDVSLGGARIYSDLPLKIGELMKLEIFAQGTAGMTYTAEVVWVEKLPTGAAAEFDVGLKFIQLEPAAVRELMNVLGPPEEDEEGK